MKNILLLAMFSILALAHINISLAAIPTPAHVVIVIEENHDYTSIIGSSAAPYINSLYADSDGALFTASSALTHPSQPNYIMLFSGANQGVTNDNVPSTFPFTAANLGSSLLDSGWTFGGYSEDLPSVGYNGGSSGAYARKHNPWANWQGGTTHGIPTSANMPLTSFPTNYDLLPTVSFVIPNQNNDMHNGGTGTGPITTGDTWLNTHLNGYIQWAKTHNSLFILTFDEGTDAGPNRIVTIFLGPMVQHGQYSEAINHYSVLRTIEDMYGIVRAGASSSATPITDCWVSATGVLDGAVSMPTHTTLQQNYPNPFNPSTAIGFSLPGVSNVTLKVYTLQGEEVATLLNNKQMEAGEHTVAFNASGLSSGVYLYRITSNRFSETKKLVVVK